nr:MAG TPA: hypothetical protein [Caudoviricetes sp.]
MAAQSDQMTALLAKPRSLPDTRQLPVIPKMRL